jgi:hypothetical protein
MPNFKTLEDKIRYEEKRPTTFDQLRYALKNDVNIVDYLDLANVSNLEQLFENSLNVIIFFPVESEFQGHYTCMCYYPDQHLISYFCPYGMSPMRNIILSNYLKRFDENMLRVLPNLIKTFCNNGGKFLVNSYQLQSKKNSIATCGRHVTMRIMNRDIIDPTEYKNFLKMYNLTPDQIVSLVFL